MIKKLFLAGALALLLFILISTSAVAFVAAGSAESGSGYDDTGRVSVDQIEATYELGGDYITVKVKDASGTVIMQFTARKGTDGAFSANKSDEWSAEAVFSSYATDSAGSSLKDSAGNNISRTDSVAASAPAIRYGTEITASGIDTAYCKSYTVRIQDETLNVSGGVYYFSFPVSKGEKIITEEKGTVTFLSVPADIEGTLEGDKLSFSGSVGGEEIYVNDAAGYIGQGALRLGENGGEGGIMIFPIESGFTVVTSEFSIRTHPIFGYVHQHSGIDMACPTGSRILAAQGGIVTAAGWYGGYGNYIEITHPGGLKSRYGHLSKIKTKRGATVEAGELIALSGSTGNSTGPHLHFEVVKNGILQNPRDYIAFP